MRLNRTYPAQLPNPWIFLRNPEAHASGHHLHIVLPCVDLVRLKGQRGSSVFVPSKTVICPKLNPNSTTP